MAWNSDYVDVAQRMAQLAKIHPEASLQTVSIEFQELEGQTLVIYTAACVHEAFDVGKVDSLYKVEAHICVS